jgi:hypothetical protein
MCMQSARRRPPPPSPPPRGSWAQLTLRLLLLALRPAFCAHGLRVISPVCVGGGMHASARHVRSSLMIWQCVAPWWRQAWWVVRQRGRAHCHAHACMRQHARNTAHTRTHLGVACARKTGLAAAPARARAAMRARPAGRSDAARGRMLVVARASIITSALQVGMRAEGVGWWVWWGSAARCVSWAGLITRTHTQSHKCDTPRTHPPPVAHP